MPVYLALYGKPFFYLSNDVRYFGGLAFCILVTYVTGLLLGREGGRGRKALLFSGVGFPVLALLLFRYPLAKSALVPLGISFYALQAMGYVIEVYKGSIKPEKNLVRYAVYVAFFPTVMSGPIQRAPKLLEQIREGNDFDYNKVHSGLYLLLWATILYAVQLYCDFAGYSALAMGAAGVLSFDIGRNFEQPYFAASVKDFWKRWHISLSSWLRDYVYIPLGGNRKGKCRKSVNLMVTFLVSGLWHGAGIHYLVWGGIHGIYQVLESCIPKRSSRGGALRRIVGSVFTFALVDFAWLFFRSDSMTQALGILYRIFFYFQFKEMTYYGSYLMGRTKAELLLLLAGITLVFFVDLLHEKRLSISPRWRIVRILWMMVEC